MQINYVLFFAFVHMVCAFLLKNWPDNKLSDCFHSLSQEGSRIWFLKDKSDEIIRIADELNIFSIVR